MRRRIRPTMLLRCLALAISLALFVFVFLIFGYGSLLGKGLFVFLIAFWFLGIEGGLLPILLEWLLVRKFTRVNSTLRRLLLRAEDNDRKALERLLKDSEENPTIR
jgi:hypothetical protein